MTRSCLRLVTLAFKLFSGCAQRIRRLYNGASGERAGLSNGRQFARTFGAAPVERNTYSTFRAFRGCSLDSSG